MGGAQHREFQKEILQTMQVGVGPNTEADEKSAYNNVQVGGPQHREFQKKFYRQCKLGINEINFVKRLFLSHSQKSLHNKSLRAL
ncbi:hypothetical protein CW319_12840 [Staphylococcus aureus]|nr:hypothetical protein CW319_12840 [Staphylococcus aureus]